MQKWKTRQVMVGNVGVGGDNPVRIQSMTTSNTRDVQATVEQIMRLADEGCEIARVTVQGKKEADACEGIKNTLVQKGYLIPVVADIHFYPPAAMRVVEFVDKVRINPGNFVDKRAQFEVIEYDDRSYAEEIEKIEEKFAPLVEKCILYKRALRIGVNHGSLSDRIMSRYGDTARGMVESAFEFTRVARKMGYHDIIYSMKASNTLVMIEAYRLLVTEMMKLGWDYPLHLGVTEAGEGEDGRVKSSIGTGSLLLDGIGDTIRVSLTEDPWCEIDPCKRLVRFGATYPKKPLYALGERRKSLLSPPEVVLSLSEQECQSPTLLEELGFKTQLGRPLKDLSSCDALIVSSKGNEKLAALEKVGVTLLQTPFVLDEEEKKWERLLTEKPERIFFAPKKEKVTATRRFFEWLEERRIYRPVILQFSYDLPFEDLVIAASAEIGTLFCQGLADGLLLEGPYSVKERRELSLSILQGARQRSSKTEFISCPGCGRTLFNLQTVAAKIREKTAHLPGVKIAIMGCIVNGPGEMADADFGYVGSKPGKIDLYVGKECVQRDIEMSEAEDRLVDLIKSHGKWIEPALT